MINLHGTVKSYLIGFLLSIILSLIAYNLVLTHPISNISLIALIIIIAFVQLFVQLIFFIHLGQDSPPKWHLIFFISTFCAILAIVVGSIWIMSHLNYNMTPKQMNQYIKDQSGI
ncbi:MAG TPA: cytochrome o ubiquinol oxidase subunit IV [Candidatus Saccharimonadales bacterium]|nr:cytochrome o ubiquinol oxidase subunit IV [Candidatus Saccharimonadales bacterium]